MALNPGAPCILVTPTGNTNESERGRIIVVENSEPAHTVHRGVVEEVGTIVQGKMQKGDVLFYTEHFTLLDKHVVPEQYVLGWEDGLDD